MPNHFLVTLSLDSQLGLFSIKSVSFSKTFSSGFSWYSSVEPMIILFFVKGIMFLPLMLKCFGRDNKLTSCKFVQISKAWPRTGFNLILWGLSIIKFIELRELHKIIASVLISLLLLEAVIHCLLNLLIFIISSFKKLIFLFFR